MKGKLTVKVTFRASDPFDADIIGVLQDEKNKSAYIRKALFCFIRGMGQSQSSSLPDAKPVQKDRELNEKLSKLTTF